MAERKAGSPPAAGPTDETPPPLSLAELFTQEMEREEAPARVSLPPVASAVKRRARTEEIPDLTGLAPFWMLFGGGNTGKTFLGRIFAGELLERKTGRFILAVFLGLAVISHLKRGVWRPAWGTLSWPEAGKSLGLYLLTAALCAAAAVGAMLPVAEGAPVEAVRLGLAYLGVRL